MTIPKLILLLQVLGFVVAIVALGFVWRRVGAALSLGFIIGFAIHVFADLWKVKREGL